MLPPAVLDHWMTQAYELACSAARIDEVPVGAVLVGNQDILGVGFNRRERTSRVVAHAEIVALEDYAGRSSQWRVPKGSSLFVTTEPCLMCVGALLWARVDNIYFGCADPKQAGVMRMLPLLRQGIYDHKFKDIRGGILAEKCGALMSGYFQKKRQKPMQETAPISS